MPLTTTCKTIIVTGGSSGLGFEALRQLLKSAPAEVSYRVCIGCRSPRAAEIAYRSISLPDRHALSFLPLELNSLQSVKAFGEKVQQTDGQIHTLLLNAAIVRSARSDESLTFAYCEAYTVNHLSQLYLLQLLEAQIKESHGRVVIVSSMLYKSVKNVKELLKIVSHSSAASPRDIYAATKFIQLLGVLQARRRLGKEAEIVAISPGFVPATGLSRDSGWLGSIFMRYVMPLAPFASSLQEGGKAIVRAIETTDTLDDVEHILLDKTGVWQRLDDRLFEPGLEDQWCPSKEDIERMYGVQRPH